MWFWLRQFRHQDHLLALWVAPSLLRMGPLTSPLAPGLLQAWLFGPFPCLLYRTAGEFCILADLCVVEKSCSMGDLGPPCGVWGWWYHELGLDFVLDQVTRAYTMFSRSWTETRGRLDALLDFDRNIRQQGSSCGAFIDSFMGLFAL